MSVDEKLFRLWCIIRNVMSFCERIRSLSYGELDLKIHDPLEIFLEYSNYYYLIFLQHAIRIWLPDAHGQFYSEKVEEKAESHIFVLNYKSRCSFSRETYSFDILCTSNSSPTLDSSGVGSYGHFHNNIEKSWCNKFLCVPNVGMQQVLNIDLSAVCGAGDCWLRYCNRNWANSFFHIFFFIRSNRKLCNKHQRCKTCSIAAERNFSHFHLKFEAIQMNGEKMR